MKMRILCLDLKEQDSLKEKSPIQFGKYIPECNLLDLNFTCELWVLGLLFVLYWSNFVSVSVECRDIVWDVIIFSIQSAAITINVILVDKCDDHLTHPTFRIHSSSCRVH